MLKIIIGKEINFSNTTSILRVIFGMNPSSATLAYFYFLYSFYECAFSLCNSYMALVQHVAQSIAQSLSDFSGTSCELFP